MSASSFVAKKTELVAIIYLGIGSNTCPEANLRLGIDELAKRFEVTAISSVYRNAAVGFEGDDFLNAVVCAETARTPGEICAELDEIHVLAGRKRGTDPFVSRTLDIDLLLYDQLVVNEPPVRIPRDDVLRYSFVLGPLAEIAPTLVHPVTGKTIAWHWAAFDRESHPISLESLIL